MSTVEPDALTRRIEQLAAMAVDEPEGGSAALTALVGALRGEIGAVRAELGSLRSEMGAVRTDLDGLGGRLTGSVAASRSETGALVRRVAELSTRLEGLGGRVDDVRTGLPALSRELREGLDAVPARTSGRLDELTTHLDAALADQSAKAVADLGTTLRDALAREAASSAEQREGLADARAALEARLAMVEDTLDGMAERIEAFARDGAGRTIERLDDLRAGVSALERRLEQQAREQADALVGRFRDVADTRISELETSLFGRVQDALHARNEELRRELRESLEGVAAQTGEARTAVSELADTVGSGLDGFGAVLDRSLASLGGNVSTALSDDREQTRASTEAVADRLVRAVGGLQEELGARSETTAGQLSGFQSAVEARIESVRGQVASSLTDLRSDVAGEVGALAPQLSELEAATHATSQAYAELRTALLEQVGGLRDQVATTGSGTAELVRSALAATRSDLTGLTGALGDRVAASSEEQAEAVRASLVETREQVLATTGTLREELLAQVTEAYATVSARLAAMGEQVAEGTGASRETTDRLGALTGASEQVRRAVEESRTSVTAATAALAEQLLSRAAEQAGTLDAGLTALRTLVTERLAELSGTVDGSAADARDVLAQVTALSAASEQLRDHLEGRFEVLRDDVVDAARDLRKELLTTTGEQLADLAERFDELDTVVDEGQAELGEKVGFLDVTVRRGAKAAEGLAEAVAEIRSSGESVRASVEGFGEQWPVRTTEVVEGARAAAAAVVVQVRAEVEAQLERVQDVLARAAEGVDEAREDLDAGTDRLGRAGEVLVAYLEQRDRLLEAERDRVLHEVLDQFAAGLSAKERSALAGRVGDAVARRRDARDADRYRAAVGEPAPPTAALPADLRDTLPGAPRRGRPSVEAVDEPVQDDGPSDDDLDDARAAGPTPPAEKAPGRKTTATKAPAAKAPAKKAPAEKAPSAKAPAKKAPAAKAPAAKAPAAKAPAKKAPAAKAPATKAPAAKAPAKKAPAKASTAKTPAKGRPAKTPAAAKPPAPAPSPAKAPAAAQAPAAGAGDDDAVVPVSRSGSVAQAASRPPEPEPETSWASRAPDAPPADADDDTSVRRLFPRRRP